MASEPRHGTTPGQFRDSWARRGEDAKTRPATAAVELGTSSSAAGGRQREQSVVNYWGGGGGQSALRMKVFEPVSSTVWSITGRSFGLCPPPDVLSQPLGAARAGVCVLTAGGAAGPPRQDLKPFAKVALPSDVDAMDFSAQNVSVCAPARSRALPALLRHACGPAFGAAQPNRSCANGRQAPSWCAVFRARCD